MEVHQQITLILVMNERFHSFVLIQKNQKIKAYKTLRRQHSQIASAGG
jgi:hypothetical protein